MGAGLGLSVGMATACADIAGLSDFTSGAAAVDVDASDGVATGDGGTGPGADACGARLTVLPGTVDFGEVKVSTPATGIPVTLKNAGSAPITFFVQAALTDGFGLAWPGSPGAIALNPGDEVVLTATFTPGSTGPVSAQATLQTNDAVCGALPSISLQGKGTLSAVTVQPGGLDFGPQSCGDTVPGQQIVLRNAGTNPIAWTATLQFGTAFTLGPVSGALQPADSVPITVTPKVVPDSPLGDLNDTVQISTPPDTHTVSVHERAQGVVFTFSPATLAFSASAGLTQTKPFTVQNTGNVEPGLGAPHVATSGQFSVKMDDWPYYDTTVYLAWPGATARGSVTFTAPATSGTYNADLAALLSSPKVCHPAGNANSISLTGTVP